MEVNFTGYGRTAQEIYLSFKNTGDIPLTNVSISVDGKFYKEVEVSFGPGRTFVESLFLEEGEHLIEARTPEGAYASVKVKAKAGAPTTETKIKVQPFSLIWILVAIVAIALILWLAKKV
jgi:uncharacterized membrane protein